jgi:hypothetical protein
VSAPETTLSPSPCWPGYSQSMSILWRRGERARGRAGVREERQGGKKGGRTRRSCTASSQPRGYERKSYARSRSRRGWRSTYSRCISLLFKPENETAGESAPRPSPSSNDRTDRRSRRMSPRHEVNDERVVDTRLRNRSGLFSPSPSSARLCTRAKGKRAHVRSGGKDKVIEVVVLGVGNVLSSQARSVSLRKREKWKGGVQQAPSGNSENKPRRLSCS